MIDEPPPFLGSWKRVYAAVVVYLIAVIVIFAAFGRAFTR
jgi:ABC-type glycerol-3-phosphate transport system permease component